MTGCKSGNKVQKIETKSSSSTPVILNSLELKVFNWLSVGLKKMTN